ncbi:hypothetical protein NPIL_73411 [Nephila pilipes]|uniref:Uncharacterized protein n=1 Tax=Nephila pilipes TaxID=299642 RepID=A0A8X6QK54_NEPPI|nr:hypothetical protein NPIL_73411 [Nephila pilipes]
MLIYIHLNAKTPTAFYHRNSRQLPLQPRRTALLLLHKTKRYAKPLAKTLPPAAAASPPKAQPPAFKPCRSPPGPLAGEQQTQARRSSSHAPRSKPRHRFVAGWRDSFFIMCAERASLFKVTV